MGEQVGHAGQVGEDVVAVGADDGRELAQHLQQLGGHAEQQRVLRETSHAAGDADGDEALKYSPPRSTRSRPQRDSR